MKQVLFQKGVSRATEVVNEKLQNDIQGLYSPNPKFKKGSLRIVPKNGDYAVEVVSTGAIICQGLTREKAEKIVREQTTNSLHLQTEADVRKYADEQGVPVPNAGKMKEIMKAIRQGVTDGTLIPMITGKGSPFWNGASKAAAAIGEKLGNVGLVVENSDIKRAYYDGAAAKKKGEPRTAYRLAKDDRGRGISGEVKDEWLRGWDEETSSQAVKNGPHAKFSLEVAQGLLQRGRRIFIDGTVATSPSQLQRGMIVEIVSATGGGRGDIVELK